MTAPEQALTRGLLERADQFSWTVQGFGMTRTYLDRDDQRWRLNIWDDRLQTPDVSLVHDHPWSFVSHIICGRIVNQRYDFEEAGRMTHLYKKIVTGESSRDASEPRLCRLVPRRQEVYTAGTTYSQRLNEVHETKAQRGTVTLNDRTAPTVEYTARVFWPDGYPWTAAKPRPATWSEVEMVVTEALRRL